MAAERSSSVTSHSMLLALISRKGLAGSDWALMYGPYWKAPVLVPLVLPVLSVYWVSWATKAAGQVVASVAVEPSVSLITPGYRLSC